VRLQKLDPTLFHSPSNKDMTPVTFFSVQKRKKQNRNTKKTKLRNTPGSPIIGHVEDERHHRAARERGRHPLRLQELDQGLRPRVCKQARDQQVHVSRGDLGQGFLLTQKYEDGFRPEPAHADHAGDGREQERAAVRGVSELGQLSGAKGAAAKGLEPEGHADLQERVGGRKVDRFPMVSDSQSVFGLMRSIKMGGKRLIRRLVSWGAVRTTGFRAKRVLGRA
jgi:hypothetical protein